jgi:hypothetical protein
MATQSDQTNTGVVTTIVVVGSFAMITISAMVTAMVRAEEARLDAERPTNADLQTVATLEQQQLERLTAPAHWVSQPGGKVTLPIERAMQVVIDEYRKNPEAASPPPPPGMQMNPTPATPVGAAATPAAPGTPQPTGSTPTPAVPNAAAPDPATTPRVVPPASAPGPAAAPPPGPPTTPAAPAPGRP